VSTGEDSTGVTVAVTDHAAERFRQRVAARAGELDPRPEIIGRVARSWAAGRISENPPDARSKAPRGALYVADLIDRDVVFVVRHDRRSGEVVVITLWERRRLGVPRVPQRFTDALKDHRPSGLRY
jgi:hypothetical protein